MAALKTLGAPPLGGANAKPRAHVQRAKRSLRARAQANTQMATLTQSLMLVSELYVQEQQ